MMDMMYFAGMMDFGFDWMTVVLITAIALIALTVYFVIVGIKSGNPKIPSKDIPVERVEKKYAAGKIAIEE